MRDSFTKNEQRILREINDNNLKEKENGVFLSNIIDNNLRNAKIIFSSNQSVAIKFNSGNSQNPQSEKELIKILNFIIEAIMLLNEFEKEGFISLFSTINIGSYPHSYGQLIENTSENIEHIIPDGDFKNLMIGCFQNKIFSSLALNEFIDNGFITKEEKRFKHMRFFNIILISANTILILVTFFAIFLQK
ncbi:MAG: hypothetical protein EVG15_06915 [Candidatus Acididesulfobacter diazotrophicus]|jgi:hypothetical protein|uniref:Uncharacterized protein n=1 Tax=Candidatus Acididesulfobacter diazotrophicus TaxID=2597226 RepID=A0A519BM47_9DELT|nr:MAG: hypothetical protein EVG15_06915 [Candidatus Acididesulfobacter diazotrophicus]